MRINTTPSNMNELKKILEDFIEDSAKKITLNNDKMSLSTIVEQSEKLIESKGHKVRIITKGTGVASLLTVSMTGGLSLVAKAGHLLATYDPEYEIVRGFLKGEVDIIKKKVM